MPFLFHVDESMKVFHVEAIGEVTDTELMDLIARLRQEAAFVSGYPILCDCLALTTVSISASRIELLARAARLRTNFVAVIASRPVAFGLARMYQIFSDPEYERIHVFAEAEEALAWLETSTRGLALSALSDKRDAGKNKTLILTGLLTETRQQQRVFDPDTGFRPGNKDANRDQEQQYRREPNTGGQ